MALGRWPGAVLCKSLHSRLLKPGHVKTEVNIAAKLIIAAFNESILYTHDDMLV